MSLGIHKESDPLFRGILVWLQTSILRYLYEKIMFSCGKANWECRNAKIAKRDKILYYCDTQKDDFEAWQLSKSQRLRVGKILLADKFCNYSDPLIHEIGA